VPTLPHPQIYRYQDLKLFPVPFWYGHGFALSTERSAAALTPKLKRQKFF
jgi:hypothetical protein